jgi:uncharacterized protein
MLRFAWDERKNRANRLKHGIWFEEARSVFHDLHARMFYDPEHSEEEDRFLLLGMSGVQRARRGARRPDETELCLRLPRIPFAAREASICTLYIPLQTIEVLDLPPGDRVGMI